MKMPMIALILSVCTAMFASDSTLYRDEDTGFVMELPNELKETWAISNLEMGFDVKVFQTQKEEKISAVIVAKCPIQQNEMDPFGSMYANIDFADVFQNITAQSQIEASDEESEDEITCNCELLPSLASEESQCIRLRFNIAGFEETPIVVDVHVFVVDGFSVAVGTCQFPVEQDADLEAFTSEIASTIRFISE